MTECARCGDCCDPVILTFDPQVRPRERLAADGPELDDAARYDYEFMLAHWRAVRPYVGAVGAETGSFEVECDQFDKDRRVCLAQDAKPPICADYPWYGRPPGDPGRTPVAEFLSPRCSYNADVAGRRMLPIVEIR